MFTRVYFFKVESIPTLRAERRKKELVTCVTGFVRYKSFFSSPDDVQQYILDHVSDDDLLFIRGEIMLTGLSRL